MYKTTTQNQKLNVLVHQQVIRSLQGILNDPDFGLELRPEFIRRLKKSVREKEKGHCKPLTEVLRQYSSR